MQHASALPTASSLLMKLWGHCGTQSTHTVSWLPVMWTLDTRVSPPVSENSISVDLSAHTVMFVWKETRSARTCKVNSCRSTSGRHILPFSALEELKGKCRSFLHILGNMCISEKKKCIMQKFNWHRNVLFSKIKKVECMCSFTAEIPSLSRTLA